MSAYPHEVTAGEMMQVPGDPRKVTPNRHHISPGGASLGHDSRAPVQSIRTSDAVELPPRHDVILRFLPAVAQSSVRFIKLRVRSHITHACSGEVCRGVEGKRSISPVMQAVDALSDASNCKPGALRGVTPRICTKAIV